MAKLPDDLLALIGHLKKLSGVGTRTAERFAFELLGWPKEDLEAIGTSLKEIKDRIPLCSICGCLTNQSRCLFCEQTERNSSQLCIVSSPRDVFAIESTRSYKGLYHVIEHLLSPLDGRKAATLRLDKIEARIEKEGITEAIIAFDSTLEGDTTALYLKNVLSRPALNISRLAFGMPVGSNFEQIDGGTLARALSGRQSF